MGQLSKLFGRKNQPKPRADGYSNPYIDAGVSLMFQLIAVLKLSDWHEGLPVYSSDEIVAIDRKLSDFQKMANDVGGGEVTFHPEAIVELQPMLCSQALIELAGGSWIFFSDELPQDWKQDISTYLKAWVSKFDPEALMAVGNLIAKAGYRNEAKTSFHALLLFPTYAEDYFAGQQTPDVVDNIVQSAKDALQELV